MSTWRKVGCCLAAVAGLSFGARADVPVAPTINLATYIDGYVTLSIGNSSGMTGLAVQTKRAEDVVWQDVAGFVKRSDISRWSLATNYVGTLQFRFAMKNAEGTGEYCEPIDIAATLALKGTIIDSNAYGAYAFDGDLGTVADTAWTGLDFGQVVSVKKIRCVFRFDAAWPQRWGNSPFEIATDAAFGDATTITNVTYKWPCNEVFEYDFDPPVETRYIRHRSPAGFSSLVALEFLSDGLYEKPELSVAYDDLDTFHARCSWTVNPAVFARRHVLQRGRSADGPWTTLAEYGAGDQFVYVDEGAKTGVQYYYRVQATSGHPSFDGQVLTSAAVPYRPLRRLERETTATNALREGVSLLVSGGTVAEAAEAFDGKYTTWPDCNAAAAVGVDLGESAYIAAFSYNCRNATCSDRVKLTLLYGSNSQDNWLADRTQLSAAITEYTTDGSVLYYKVLPGDSAQYQQVFLYGSGAWYGNVSEIGIFGWTQADIDAAGFPIAPSEVRFVRGEGGTSVTISWSAGLNVESYRVEALQGGEWTELTTVAADAERSYVATGLVPGNDYAYRIVAVNAVDETPTDVKTYSCYAGGDGTGLRGFYRVPADPTSLAFRAEKDVYRESRVSCPYIAETTDRLILDETQSDEQVVVTWKGTLIVPFADTYAFAANVKVGDGAALELDAHNLVFDLVKRGVNDTIGGSVYLTKGEHPITVTYYYSTGVKKFDLTWQSDQVSVETIPVSQLKPADADADLGLKFGDWTFGTRTDNDGFGYAVDKGDGAYELVYADRSNSNLHDDEFSWLFRPVHGDFDFRARVSGGGIRVGIMVRAADGKYFSANTQQGNYLAVKRLSPSTKKNFDELYNGRDGKSTYFRILRRGKVFSFYTHDDKATDPESEWVQMAETEVSRADFPRDAVVGAFTCRGTNPVESRQLSISPGTVKDIYFKELNRGTVLLVK